MADISKIKTPNGDVYDVKDLFVRDNLYLTEQIEVELEQGGISSSDGSPTQSSTSIHGKRLRSSYIDIPNKWFSFTVPSDYEAGVYFYSNTEYTSYVRYSDSWETGTIKVENGDARFIRIIIRKSDNASITPSSISQPIVLTKYSLIDIINSIMIDGDNISY